MISEKDGIHIDLDKKIVADSRNTSGDINFVSHAHFDHLHTNSSSKVVCSDLTAMLAEARTGKSIEHVSKTDRISLIDSGHIVGSSAALINNDGEKILYTGDFSTRDRTYMNGFEPVDADVLILESTYGIPAYTFPDQRQLEKQIVDWIQDNPDPLFLFGYSLGKAQKIQYLVKKATDRPLMAHGAVKKMNEAVESSKELDFNAKPYGKNKDLMEDNGVFIGPPNFSKTDALNNLVDKVGGVKAGFSGWATDGSYQYRGGYDETFAFSDHADFNELVKTVKQVDPEKVYTTHGFDEELASYLKRELGYNARALKKNQSSLTDF